MHVSQARPDRILAGLEDGIPPILLLESGATRLHYVVLVGLDDEVAWIHDPNFGPSQEIARDELLRRWRASGFWAAHVVPSRSAPDETDPSRPSPRARSLDPLADAAAESAMERIRSGDFEEARATAGTLMSAGEDEAALGRRLRATAWFLEGERTRALEEWNVLGEPTLDLVRIRGMEHTRYQVAERRLSLEYGDVLTPASSHWHGAGSRLSHPSRRPASTTVPWWTARWRSTQPSWSALACPDTRRWRPRCRGDF